MKRFFTLLLVPVMGIALSLVVLPKTAKADDTDTSSKKKKKKKKDSGTGLHQSVVASN